MGQTLDGITATPSQDGARIVTLPLQDKGNYYAIRTRRNMVVTPATAFTPIVGDRASYTNLLTYSEAFDNAAWTKTNVTVSADATANPVDGTATADAMLEATGIGSHYVTRNVTFTAGTYTLSFFIKPDGRNYAIVSAYDGTTYFYVLFDISSTASLSSQSATGSIKAINGGWYACTITFTAASGSGRVQCYAKNTSEIVSKQGLVFDGTAGATVASVPAFGTGSWSEAFWFKVNAIGSDQPLIGAATDGGTQPLAYINPTGKLALSSGAGSIIAGNTTLVAGTWYHGVITHNGVTAIIYLNGVADGSTSNSSNFNLSVAKLAVYGTASASACSIYQPLIYNRALSASEVQSLYQTGAPAAADYWSAGSAALNTSAWVNSSTAFTSFTSSGASAFTVTAGASQGRAESRAVFSMSSGQRLTFTGSVASLSGTADVYLVTSGGTTGSAVSTAAINTNGTFTVTLTATATDSGMRVAVGAAGAWSGTFTSIIVQPLGLLLAPNPTQTGSGTTWADLSGNSATITLPGSGVYWAIPANTINYIATAYSGDTTKGLYLYGGQLVAATTAPYIATTAATRAVTVPTVDIDDPFAFIVEEQEPDTGALELGVYKWTRVFERVPPRTTTPSSVTLTKPSLNTAPTSGTYLQSVGSYRVFQPDASIEQYDAYYANTVTSDTGAPSFYPTGGTYTLSFGGSTTGSLAYSATAGDVQTALNALTPVSNRGNVTVSGTYNSSGGFTVTFTAYGAISYDVSSITVASGTPVATTQSLNSGYTQQVIIGSSLSLYSYPYQGAVSGGTFTITVGANTTAAIAYNASAATIQTALNLLTSVTNRGGCTVTGLGWDSGTSSIQFTINFVNTAITGSAGSLTPAPSSIAVTSSDAQNRVSVIRFSGGSAIRTVYAASHGISATDVIYIKGGSTYYSAIASGSFLVVDANTLQLIIAANSSYASASTITEVGKKTKTSYKPGTVTIRSVQTTNFYLTGYTPGIAADSDIPIPTNQSETSAFLQAIFAGTGTINYIVGDLQRYYGPIYELTTTTVNAADL